MLHCSASSISSCFCFFLLVLSQNSSSTRASSVDVISETCTSCAGKSTILNYAFCINSLQAVAVSHASDLPGLVIIAMELAIENATRTVWSIEKMLTSEAFGPFAMECLRDCLELYADAVSMLVNSLGAFLSKYYDAANLLIDAAMEAASTCEDGFLDKDGGVSPLTKENNDFVELSDIALCIVNMFPSDLASVSS